MKDLIAPDQRAPTSYAAAEEEIQQILALLQQPDSPLDALTERVTRAKFLLDWSRERLRATAAEIDQLLTQE